MGKLSHVEPEQPTSDRVLQKYITPLLSLDPSKQHCSVPHPALRTPIDPLTCSRAFSHTPAILYTAPTHIQASSLPTKPLIPAPNIIGLGNKVQKGLNLQASHVAHQEGTYLGLL